MLYVVVTRVYCQTRKQPDEKEQSTKFKRRSGQANMTIITSFQASLRKSNITLYSGVETPHFYYQCRDRTSRELKSQFFRTRAHACVRACVFYLVVDVLIGLQSLHDYKILESIPRY